MYARSNGTCCFNYVFRVKTGLLFSIYILTAPEPPRAHAGCTGPLLLVSGFAHTFGRLWSMACTDLFFNAPPDVGVDIFPILNSLAPHRFADSAQKAAGDRIHQARALLVAEHIANKGARLAKIVVVAAQRIGAAHHRAVGFPAVCRRPGFVSPFTVMAVGGIHRSVAAVMVRHVAVEHVSVHRHLGLIDRQLMEIGADTITLRVVIGKGTTE